MDGTCFLAVRLPEKILYSLLPVGVRLVANDCSALTDELKLRKDNSAVIEQVLSFLTATVLFA